MNRVLKNTTILIFFNFFARFLGFIREVLIAFFFGATLLADSFNTAIVLPNLLFNTIKDSITLMFIPLYNDNGDNDKKNRFTSNYLNVSILFVIFLCITYSIFSEQIISLFFPSITGEFFKLTISMSRILILLVLFNAISGVLRGFFNANNEFLIPSVGLLLSNIFIIGTIILLNKVVGIYSIVFGFVFGALIQLIYEIIKLKKYNFRYFKKIDFDLNQLKSVLISIIPITITTIFMQLNTLIDKSIASGFETGSLSYINYSTKIANLPALFITASITSVFYPIISRLVVQSKFVELQKLFNQVVVIIIIIIIPIIVGLLIYNDIIVSIFFERGEFTHNDTINTARLLFFYTFGILGESIRLFIVRLYFSKNNTIIPMYSSISSVIVNIILNIILSNIFGIIGLAIATSIAYWINALILIFKLPKIYAGQLFVEFNISYFKIFSSVIISGLFVLIFNELIILPNSIFQIFIFTIIYLILLSMFKTEEIFVLKNKLIHR